MDLIAVVVALAFFAGQPSQDQRAIDAFRAAADQYAVLVRRVKGELGPLLVSERPEQVLDAARNLRAAMRRARASAREGDLFTSGVSPQLRERIRSAVANLQRDGDALFDDINKVDQANASRALEINGPFPWNTAATISPGLIEALPPLPAPLEYRFLGTDLVLVDIEAGMVVDILRGALPGPAPADRR